MPSPRRRLVLTALAVALFAAAPVGVRSTTVAAMAHSAASPFVPAGLDEIERGARTLEQIASGFPSPAEAESLLVAWGWQANAYFNYAGSTAAGTASLEVSFHLFGTTGGATEAMSYFAASRALMLDFSPVPIARIGDEVLAIGGARDVGNEVTIYVRDGAYLVRISAVAPRGDPGPDAVATARGILGQAGVSGVRTDPGTVEALLPTVRELPAGFVVVEEGTRTEAEIADTFLRPAEAASYLAAYGFEGNVYRYFALPAGTADPDRTISIEVSLHLFEGSGGAGDALPYYADGRAEAIGLRVVGTFDIGDGAVMLEGVAPAGTGVEVTVYLLLGNVLARISAVSPGGNPTADALAATLVVAGRT
jgi:hypothetical protein